MMKGLNDDEICDFVAFTEDKVIVCRMSMSVFTARCCCVVV